MLTKLMKYELKATARVMLPLYLAVVGLAALLKLLSLWSDSLDWNGALNPATLLLQLVTIGFFLAVIAAPIAALVLMIIRFKSNLLSDEGYVMFTLPVTPHHLVWSKLLTSAIWLVGAGLVDALGFFIVTAETGLLSRLAAIFRDLLADLTANGALAAVELVVLILVTCFCSCLAFYCPMSIGHSFARHKVLLSVVFFFVIYAIRQLAGIVLITAGIPFADNIMDTLSALPEAAVLHGALLGAILCMAVYGGILYAITIRMLHRRLNLE